MHNAQTVTQRARPPLAGIIWGVVLNAVAPVVFYKLSKHYYSASEFTALVIAATFPLGKSAFELLIHRSFDPISIVVLLGITTDAVAILFGGSPRLLLIRESLFTGAFGVACFFSLLTGHAVSSHRLGRGSPRRTRRCWLGSVSLESQGLYERVV